MSLRWKPRESNQHNLISFIDGQGYYSSTYFKINDLSNKEDLLPHIVLEPQERGQVEYNLYGEQNELIESSDLR